MSENNENMEQLQAELQQLLLKTKSLLDQKYDLDVQSNLAEAEVIGLIELNINVLESRLAFYQDALAYHRGRMKERVAAMERAKVPERYQTRLYLIPSQENS
ncbi:hypothetical protein KLP40_19435 [Hymenobacter sp. NST-14]|uniref:hypothetical protein n=1 Tax=Hymenobacter piscis TaxID=2839984 RepID=UPI001C01105A|nr:hypothetical protein [Hymenobacter piscis]MBT9395349.1 hypothetical protein [Hymenobacter piscis]